jgi:putative hydrolase of HD superfamily
MIDPKIIEYIFTSASIQRWNDYPRMVELVELDKQAHKFIIAYFIAKLEDDVNMTHLIEAGLFEFFRRVVVTDIRPDVFRKALKKKGKEINNWVIDKLSDSLKTIDKGNFLRNFEAYLSDETMYQKERFILKAASYIATRWEFSIVYQTSQFLGDIETVKKEVEDEIEDYYELIGVRKIALNKKLSKIVDLSGRLRFQKRWAQTPRVPETSVLGHMLTVAILGYFYSIEIKACNKRIENNFFCALFHDLPEALTRDIISPVKYSVNDLADIISEYEILKIEDDILPFIPQNIQTEFKYLLGLYTKDSHIYKEEFINRVTIGNNIEFIDNLESYNIDKFNAIDGKILKICDRLTAYIEASISIAHGVKSKELIRGKEQILDKLKHDTHSSAVDFYALAKMIDNELNKAS